MDGVSHAELLGVVEVSAEAALRLGPRDIALMRRLAQQQLTLPLETPNPA